MVSSKIQYRYANKPIKKEIQIYFFELSNRINEMRMLGSWLGWKEDVAERLKRGSKAWWRTKNRLKGAKFSRRLQARVVEACVESSLLFDCQARTWQVGEISKLQSFIDRAYRYVWSRGNEPPLRQMQREKKNMADVRSELNVKSLRWKIEKRCLERIGHIMRMDDDRLTKAITLGWLEELENWERKPGRCRKTVTYWRKLVREAGIDYTRIDELTADRKEWKRLVNERMKHLTEFEKSKGHNWTGGQVERNKTVEQQFVHVCNSCGKVCKSKGGLTIHVKRMHAQSKLKRVFPCGDCGKIYKQEANLHNHQKHSGTCAVEQRSGSKYKAEETVSYMWKNYGEHECSPPSTRSLPGAVRRASVGGACLQSQSQRR